jgi:hypothetical protein
MSDIVAYRRARQQMILLETDVTDEAMAASEMVL